MSDAYARLRRVERESLDESGQQIWDRIAKVRNGTVQGPFGVLINVPGLANQVAALEDYFRFESVVSAADRELIIMTVAAETDAGFIWDIHLGAARRQGTREEALQSLESGDAGALTAHEAVLVEIARSLTKTRQIPAELYERALADLGQRQLIEVVTLTGHYNMISMVVNGFEVPRPESGH